MHRLKKLFSLGVPDVKRVDGATNFEGIKEARQQGETYINYGRRLCGIVNEVLRRCHHFYNAYIVRKGIRRLLTRLSSDK